MNFSANSDALHESAREGASLSTNYLVLTVASCVIATLGLIENSVAVIIGAMIVAPLIGPIQAFAYAALSGEGRLLRRSLLTAAAGGVIAIGVSAAIGALVALPSYGSEVIARTRPSLLDLAIAVAAGAVGGFAKVRPAIGNAIAGTAITVALMPPLCVVGLALGSAHWSWAEGAALLFGTNFFGIALACMIVYVITGALRPRGRVAFVTTVAITAVLLIPLGASTAEILRESRIEAEIRHELISNTVTFRHARLVSATFDWYAKPVGARLDVRAPQPLTATQVSDLEAFIAQHTGTEIRLIVDVSRYETVSANASHAASADAPAATVTSP